MLYYVTLTKFSISKISNVNIFETVETSAKIRIMTFIDIDIWQSNGIARVVLHDLNLNYQGLKS